MKMQFFTAHLFIAPQLDGCTLANLVVTPPRETVFGRGAGAAVAAGPSGQRRFSRRAIRIPRMIFSSKTASYPKTTRAAMFLFK